MFYWIVAIFVVSCVVFLIDVAYGNEIVSLITFAKIFLLINRNKWFKILGKNMHFLSESWIRRSIPLFWLCEGLQ